MVTCSFWFFFKTHVYILKAVHNESYLHDPDETCSFTHGKPASLVQNQTADFHPGLHNYQLRDHGEDIPFPGIQSHSNSGRDSWNLPKEVMEWTDVCAASPDLISSFVIFI